MVIDRGVHPQQAVQGLGHFGQEQLDQLQERANWQAIMRIEYGGAVVADMVERFGVPESGRASLEAARADFETHGPRALPIDRSNARWDIESNVPLEQAAATHGLTHPRDIAALREWRDMLNQMGDEDRA
jgi:hypothetical protein